MASRAVVGGKNSFTATSLFSFFLSADTTCEINFNAGGATAVLAYDYSNRDRFGKKWHIQSSKKRRISLRRWGDNSLRSVK
jgi:hypothetical protein